MASAAVLAQQGWEVDLFEKNETAGGRGRQFEAEGFRFDMGPSWYWMPEVFSDFFGRFGKKASDFFELVRLDPSYQVIWQDKTATQIPASLEELSQMAEGFEPGAGEKLRRFLEEAKYKYQVGMSDFVWKPSLGLGEFVDTRIVGSLMKLDMFSSVDASIRKQFSHPKLIELLSFPVLFLGATPQKTPALYTLMNYADMSLGTWYPMGGMAKIAEAFLEICKEQGVKVHTAAPVEHIPVRSRKAQGVVVNGQLHEADVVIGGADYHHIDRKLLPRGARSYSEAYWDKRAMAPSSLLYYIGLDTRLEGLQHHNLFFDESFEGHAQEIYETPQWPSKPLFYACVPSITDPSVAPEGCENLFLLIPSAAGLEGDDEQLRQRYLDILAERIEQQTGTDIRKHIIYQRSFATSDFIAEYNSYKGNAYGLANTLFQTAFLKPRMHSKKVSNLFYAGQLTVPGPGLPPSIISGQVAGDYVHKHIH